MPIIDTKTFAFENGITVTEISRQYKVNRNTLANWNKETPEIVKLLFNMAKQNPKVNILEVLKKEKNPPQVIRFLREFLINNNYEFLKLVKQC